MEKNLFNKVWDLHRVKTLVVDLPESTLPSRFTELVSEQLLENHLQIS